MGDTQHFCLRWNNYQSSITSAFENLRDDEDFVDVTLACEGKSLKAHRVVLSACSPYFRELLKSTPCKHPVIVLQDVAFADLHALVEFIYHGEVNVHQRNLNSFLKTAEVLRVSGLTQQDDREDIQTLQQNLSSRNTNQLHNFMDNFKKNVDDSLVFNSHMSPPHSLSNAAPGNATVNQLLRRAAIASSMRRERRNSEVSETSDAVQNSLPNKRPRTEPVISNSHNNNETTSLQNQVAPADLSASSLSKNQNSINSVSKQEDINCNRDLEHRESKTPPSPNHQRIHDSVKSEPMDSAVTGDIDNSNDSVEVSTGERDDHDSVHSYVPTHESKLFGSTGGSFNFTMAALSDPNGLAGLGNQGMQMNTEGAPAGTSQELQGRGWYGGDGGGGGPFCPLCQKTFTRSWSLQRHMSDTHFYVPQSLECDICGRSYRSRNSLISHKSQYHGKNGNMNSVYKDNFLFYDQT